MGGHHCAMNGWPSGNETEVVSRASVSVRIGVRTKAVGMETERRKWIQDTLCYQFEMGNERENGDSSALCSWDGNAVDNHEWEHHRKNRFGFRKGQV